MGDVVTVFDTQDQRPLGRFKVIEVRESDYMCEPEGSTDALWEGDLRQRGPGDWSPPPYTLAIHLALLEDY